MSDIGWTPTRSPVVARAYTSTCADRSNSSHGASVLARKVAQQLEKAMPKLVTATMTRSLRDGKVFLTGARTARPKTTIAPYSMRGRDQPMVAAPRTWGGVRGSGLRHLRFDEVLERVERDGDLSPRSRKRPGRQTHQPTGACATRARPQSPCPRRHPRWATTRKVAAGRLRRTHSSYRNHARDCLRLPPRKRRRAGVVGRAEEHAGDHVGEPLAVHTRTTAGVRPRSRGDPKGEYGCGGNVIVWDSGTYDTEKFRDHGPTAGEGREVMSPAWREDRGRYALIQTGGKNGSRTGEGAGGLGCAMWRHMARWSDSIRGVGVRGAVGRVPPAGQRRPRSARIAFAQWP